MEKKYWFKAKRYGYGWYPSSWQGWLVTLIYILFTFGILRITDSVSQSGKDLLITFSPPFIILTIILLVICYKTGEKPRWRWGGK